MRRGRKGIKIMQPVTAEFGGRVLEREVHFLNDFIRFISENVAVFFQTHLTHSSEDHGTDIVNSLADIMHAVSADGN